MNRGVPTGSSEARQLVGSPPAVGLLRVDGSSEAEVYLNLSPPRKALIDRSQKRAADNLNFPVIDWL